MALTAAQIDKLTIEQDELKAARHGMKQNAHMYPSGTELFRAFQRLDARHDEIQRALDAA